MDTQKKKINEYDKKNRDQLKQIKKIDDDLAELNKKNHDQSKQVKKMDDDVAGLNDDLARLICRLDGLVGTFKPATTFALLEESVFLFVKDRNQLWTPRRH